MPDWKPEIRRRLAILQLELLRKTAIVEELTQHLDDCAALVLLTVAVIAGFLPARRAACIDPLVILRHE